MLGLKEVADKIERFSRDEAFFFRERMRRREMAVGELMQSICVPFPAAVVVGVVVVCCAAPLAVI